MKKTIYKILSADSMEKLEKEVNDYCENGWILQGGISVVFYPRFGLNYFQAIYSSNNKEIFPV